MEQHQIDSAGQRLLRGVLEPLGWTVNKIENDYGRDFEIEVFVSHASTGIMFSVQLKSSRAPKYSVEHDFISQSLASQNARYLAQEVHHPVAVMVADIGGGKLFWTAPQLDIGLLNGLADRSAGRDFTVRVPTGNELPRTSSELLAAVRQVETVLAWRRALDVSPSEFAQQVEGCLDQDALRQNLRDKTDFLELRRAENVGAAGDLDAARATVKEVLRSSKSSVEMKFFGLLVGEKVETLAAARAGAPQAVLPRLALITASSMLRLTRRGPKYLKFFALLARVAGELYVLAHDDYGLYLNWRVHGGGDDSHWKLNLILARAKLARRINRKYTQCVRLARYAGTVPYRSALPVALLRMTTGAAMLIQQCEFEGLRERAGAYRAPAFQVCKLAASIGIESSDGNSVGRSAVAAAMLTRDPEDEVFRWARSQAEAIQPGEDRDWAVRALDRHAARLGGAKQAGDVYRGKEGEQIIENMASALGIDLTDPHDEVAQLVRVGIADRNPGRILKECSHLFLSLGHRGWISAWLGLPTMGEKVIHCPLRMHSARGWSLDATYAYFKRDYCDGCPEASPRPADWEYADEWQQAENERHREYMEGFSGSPGRRLPPLPLPPDIERQMNPGGETPSD